MEDKQHQEDVESVGDMFFPTVVETLDLQSPSSLRTLRLISCKASFLNYIPLAVDMNNVCELLSVYLWTCNTLVVLSRLVAEGLLVQEWDFSP